MKFTTKLQNVSDYKFRKICYLSLQWCVNNIKSHRKRHPTITISKKENTGLYGMYCHDTNHITIFQQTFNKFTIRSLISTIIHEYRHSQQKDFRKYTINEKYTYWNNPLEVDARFFERKYWNICYGEIKDKVIN
jgi:hypothetical protein